MPGYGATTPSAPSTPNPSQARQQGANDAAKTVGLSAPPKPSVPGAPSPSMPAVAGKPATQSPGLMAPPKPGVAGMGAPPTPSAQVAAVQVPGGAAKVGAFSMGVTPEQRVQESKRDHVRQPPTNELGHQQIPAGVQAAFQYLETPSESDPYTIPSYVP